MKITRQDLEKLSVYEAIDYVRELEPEYITKPKKPILKSNPTSKEAKEYAVSLEQYETYLEVYKIKNQERGEISAEMYAVLEDYIKDMSGLYEVVPKEKQDKVWEYAWEQGHSSGYSEIYNYLQNIVELWE